MKRIALTTALVLGFAAPAAAQSPLDFAVAHFNQSLPVSEQIVIREDIGLTDRAAEIFEQLAAEQNETWTDPRDVIATQSYGSNGGTNQLAATLGVDAADYSRAELVAMYFDSMDDGNS